MGRGRHAETRDRVLASRGTPEAAQRRIPGFLVHTALRECAGSLFRPGLGLESGKGGGRRPLPRQDQQSLGQRRPDPGFCPVDRGSSEPANGIQTYEPYPANFEIGGYRVDGLRPLLYVLAIREPGHFYVASFNRRMGQDVALRQYFHEALLFPYFESGGEFKVAVFESAEETSLDAVLRRYPSEFVHLVRIPALPDFDPPGLPAAHSAGP